MEYGIVKTDIGWCAAWSSPQGVRAVAIGGKTRIRARDVLLKHQPLTGFSLRKSMSILESLKRYASGERVDFSSLTLDMTPLSPFERSVLRAAREVPYGKTMSYRNVARMIGRPGAYRAAARALAKNPFPIVVPCHRIIGSDGRMRGYSAPGGVALKRRLLRMEAALIRRRGADGSRG